MVRGEPSKFSSTALPSGGKLETTPTGANKCVDKSTSYLDRNCKHLTRKPREASKIFIPLDPNEIPKGNRGKTLHTDPFAEDREHYVEKRHRVKVQTPRGPQRAERRIQKPVEQPDRTVKATDFIASNGVRHTSPKRVPPAKHAMTMQKEQPPKSFNGSRRFAASPHASPSVSLAASAELGFSNQMGSPRRISNVFASSDVFTNIEPPAALMQRSTGVRINQAAANQLTMEGVFCPMRSGRAPKPSSLAPWMQESQAPSAGRRQIGSHVTQAPFAITQA